MPKVFNNSDRGVEALGWRFLPKSAYAIDPKGNKTDHIPANVAYSSQAKRLMDQGLLTIEGLKMPVAAVAAPAVVAPPAAPVREERVDGDASKELDGVESKASPHSEESRKRKDRDRGR
jgi:hypothetical protein